MAGMTRAQTEIADQVNAACARIVTLLKEGKDLSGESVESVKGEAEALISALRGAGAAGLKMAMRDQVRSALETKPETPSAEVAQIPDFMADLVARGAQEVRNLVDLNLKGGKALSAIQLEMRLESLLPDGTPDLKGELQTTKDGSRLMYENAADGMPEDSDYARQITRIKREAQNQMVTTRVEYVKRLAIAPTKPEGDSAEEIEAYESAVQAHAAQVAKFAAIKIEPGETIADAIARKYGFPLLTRSEIVMAAKRKKELEAQPAAEEDEGDTGSGSSGASLADTRSPAKILTDAIDTISWQMEQLANIDFTEAFPDLDAEERKRIVSAFNEMVREAAGYYSRALTAAEVEAEQDEADTAEADAAAAATDGANA